MRDQWNYNSVKQANEVLEHYENFIFRNKYVKFISVMNDERFTHSSYQIEIGLDHNATEDDFKVSENICAIDALHGNFSINEIPAILPVPLEFNLSLAKNQCYCNHRDPITKFSIPVKANFTSFQQEENLLLEKLTNNENESGDKDIIDNWLTNYQYGGQPVFSKHGFHGTLGAFFKLLDFPDDIFAITNWHIFFRHFHASLGEKVFVGENENGLLGTIFWRRLDTKRDVAFIKIDPEMKKVILNHSKFKIKTWYLKEPVIGHHVKHYGVGSHGSNKDQRKSEVLSTNTSVRALLSDSKSYIFKNQILIRDFTINGDSGSLVLINDDSSKIEKAIGLNFLRIREVNVNKEDKDLITYSIANNLNSIFNNSFCEKQLIHLDNGLNHNEAMLINRFTLNNYKLYK